jgi:hypothetical protein
MSSTRAAIRSSIARCCATGSTLPSSSWTLAAPIAVATRRN